jgi:hypothetical protein
VIGVFTSHYRRGEIGGIADQLRSASWEQRGSRFIGKAAAHVLDEVRATLKPLLSLWVVVPSPQAVSLAFCFLAATSPAMRHTN